MGKPKRDLTGQRFGLLTVLEPTELRYQRYTVWKCRCDCGNEVLVDGKRLQRGVRVSCGCASKARHPRKQVEDLTGQRFGRLTVVKQAPKNAQGLSQWLCQCDCGNTKVVPARYLKRAGTRSCGCLGNGWRAQDLTGKRFGRLVALYRTGETGRGGSIMWHCRCDCGNEVDVSQMSLASKNKSSCGCLRRETQEHIGDQLTFVDGTCVEWLRSRKHRSDNTSGHAGISKAGGNRWRVCIGFKGKRYWLGTFDTFAEALGVREDAEKVVHGAFVRAYERYSAYAAEHPDWASTHPFEFEVEQDGPEMYVVRQTSYPKNADVRTPRT